MKAYRYDTSSFARMLGVVALVGVCVSLAGCTRLHSYRRGYPFQTGIDGKPDLLHAPVLEAGNTTITCTTWGPGCARRTDGTFVPQDFALAYVEFDDSGELWSIGNERADRVGHQDASGQVDYPVSQLEKAVDLVQRMKQRAIGEQRQLVVLTFVHGWQNNASPAQENGPHNLQRFKDSLEYLATNTDNSKLTTPGKAGEPARPPLVVGVFFAWRGQSNPIPGVNVLTYFNRRDVANKVGGPSMTEAITELAIATKGAPFEYEPAEDCDPEKNLRGADANNRFLIVGHSFGGRALEHGVTQSMLALLLERKARAVNCIERWKHDASHAGKAPPSIKIVPPADLIVLLNPANDALEAKSMIEAFKRSGIDDNLVVHPLILSVKSDGDHATGWIMKVGQFLSSSKPAERDYDKAAAPAPAACEQGQLGLKDQEYYYKRSPGGIFNMATHQMIQTADFAPKDPKYADESSCKANNNPLDKSEQFVWGEVDPNGKGGQCFRIKTAKSILLPNAGHYNTDDFESQFYSCSPKLYHADQPGFPEKGDANSPVPVWNNTAYYVMHTPADFIHDHNDIFQVGVMNLITLMLPDQPGKTIVVKESPVTLPTASNPYKPSPQPAPAPQPKP